MENGTTIIIILKNKTFVGQGTDSENTGFKILFKKLVCVCVCVCVEREKERKRDRNREREEEREISYWRCVL
jgi:hypothetical protein